MPTEEQMAEWITYMGYGPVSEMVVTVGHWRDPEGKVVLGFGQHGAILSKEQARDVAETILWRLDDMDPREEDAGDG